MNCPSSLHLPRERALSRSPPLGLPDRLHHFNARLLEIKDAKSTNAHSELFYPAVSPLITNDLCMHNVTELIWAFIIFNIE